MSLTQVYSSYSSLSYSASASSTTLKFSEQSSAESSSANPAKVKDEGAVADVYIASESYRFEAKYSVYSETPASKPSSDNSGKTGAVQNILAFMNTRLQVDRAEGASEEQLASRLGAGLEGFIEGYQQAYEQLSSLSFLNSGVENAIEQTFSGVLEGIDALAAELGIESPVTDEIKSAQEDRRSEYVSDKNPVKTEVETPASASESKAAVSVGAASLNESVQTGSIASTVRQAGAINEKAESLRSLISASSYRYQDAESRSFNFSLTTQDGDEVTIRAAYDTVSIFNGESVSYADVEGTFAEGLFEANSGFYLDIRGDIDEDELAAIEDLLQQVKQVSDLFFANDVEAAFNYALELGFDENEIAAFSLGLRYESFTRVEETYQQISPIRPAEQDFGGIDFQDPRTQLLAKFVQALEDLRLKAENLGVTGFSDLKESDDAEVEDQKEALVGGVLARLEERANAASES